MKAAQAGQPAKGSGRASVCIGFSALLLASVFLSGCTRDGQFQALSMWNESRLKPYEPSGHPSVQSAALAPPPGTIARGELARNDPQYTGRSGGRLLAASPVPVTKALLERGQQQFIVFCSPCHGQLGDGNGMIAKRGFPTPPDYAIRRLRQAPIGHFYDVMTNGYGVMYSYAERIPVRDRWAIAAYIRVLQDARPEVRETGMEERRRAREQGVPDPTRPMRTPDPMQQPAPNAPGEPEH